MCFGLQLGTRFLKRLPPLVHSMLHCQVRWHLWDARLTCDIFNLFIRCYPWSNAGNIINNDWRKITFTHQLGLQPFLSLKHKGKTELEHQDITLLCLHFTFCTTPALPPYCCHPRSHLFQEEHRTWLGRWEDTRITRGKQVDKRNILRVTYPTASEASL